MSGYFFYSEGFENSKEPCITVDDPAGGDPRILAKVSRVYNREALWELCELANAAAGAIRAGYKFD